MNFKELVEKTGLSRGVVNIHLKSLEKEGVIKKTYESGKILNVLQLSRINVVDWFLSQLESLEVPREIMEKGRSILSEKILVFSIWIYMSMIDQMVSYASNKPEAEGGSTIFMVRTSSKRKIPVNFSNKIRPKMAEEPIRNLMTELNPYFFTVILAAYKVEKSVYPVEKKRSRRTEELFFASMPKNMHVPFDRVSEWWFKEVVDYVPSSALLLGLTGMHYNAIFQKATEDT